MSFVISPGIILPPLTAGGVAYGTGGQARVNNAGTSGQVLVSGGAGVPTFSNPSTVAVTSFSGASTGLTPSTATTGAVSLAGTLAVGSGGTSLTTLTANNVILGNGASAPTFVAPGATANVLTSSGTTWSSSPLPPAGLTYISQVVANSATTVDIENAFTDYQTYIIIGSEITTTSDFNIRVKIGGAYITSATYDFWGVGGYSGLTLPYVQQQVNFTEIFAYGFSFASVANFYLTIGVRAGKRTMINYQVNGDTTSTAASFTGAGKNQSTGALQGIRIFGSTYTGTFRLYGLANS